jgi:hypothetical protein
MWLERTKGGSKDSDVGLMILWLLLFSRRPLLIELGAEKQTQAAETKEAMSDAVRLNPWMQSQIKIQVSKVLCERTGGKLDILTTDDMGTHGSRPDVTVCNELTHVTKENFMATMMDNADKIAWNFAIIALNAGFQRSWQERWRELYEGQPDRWFFQKVSDVAPWITAENLSNAQRRNSVSRFNRLWKGIWATGKGDALDADDIALAFRVLLQPQPSAFSDHICIGGVDIGVRRDHAAVTILGAKPASHRVQLAACESWAPGADRPVNLPAVRDRILELHEIYHPSVWNFDPTEMELMAQELAQKGLSMNAVRFKGENCDIMAMALLEAFRGRRIDLYEDECLKDDLYSLRIKEIAFGKHKLEAPSTSTGGHADRGISLTIALPDALYASQLPPITYTDDVEEQITT